MDNKFRLAVMGIIYNKNNKVLIGYSPRDKSFKFPQGGINQGESPINAIFRELKEELNLDLKLEDIVMESNKKVKYYYDKITMSDDHPYANYLGQEQYVFKIKYRTDMILIPQDNEFDQMIWIKPSELINYDLSLRYIAYKNALNLCDLI